jgi:hypothetical protein
MDAAEARDRFRSTPAHNTLVVDGASQADPRGPFGWGPLPRVEVRRWEITSECQSFEGAHYGYQRLPRPAIHRRWVVGWPDGVWLVRDVVEGEGEHDFDIWLHFAPEAHVAPLEGGGVSASIGAERLIITSTAGSDWERRIETAEHSPVYGVRMAAPSVRWSKHASCPVEFAAIISFGCAGVLEQVEPGVYDYKAAESRQIRLQ